jgi:hypothetical protein
MIRLVRFVSLILFGLLLVSGFPDSLTEASGLTHTPSGPSRNQDTISIASTTIEIANLSCQELSALGSAIGKVLNEERKLGNIRKIAVVRAQQLAGEAEDVGGLFSGPMGFFKKFLADLGWIKVQPPENVVSMSIDSKAATEAIGAVAGQWLQSLGPAGTIGAAIVKVLTPGAKWLGKEWAIKDALGNIGYFKVMKPGFGTMDVIYDKRVKEAIVNVNLEDLEDKLKIQYGWEDERIYMYIPFEPEPPKLRESSGDFAYRLVIKDRKVQITTPPMPTPIPPTPTPAPAPAPKPSPEPEPAPSPVIPETAKPDVTKTELRSQRIRDRLEQWCTDNGYTEYLYYEYVFIGQEVWAIVGRQVTTGPGCVIHSDDEGVTWQTKWEKESTRMRRIHFLDRDRGFFATYGSVWETGDGGMNWKRIFYIGNMPGMRIWWIDDLIVENDKEMVIKAVGGVNESIVTKDGGKTWELIHYHGRYYGSVEGVLRTYDGGETWEEIDVQYK